MPQNPLAIWRGWAEHMLPCVTMQCGILALPFHSARTDWEQLPVAASLKKTDLRKDPASLAQPVNHSSGAHLFLE